MRETFRYTVAAGIALMMAAAVPAHGQDAQSQAAKTVNSMPIGRSS